MIAGVRPERASARARDRRQETGDRRQRDRDRKKETEREASVLPMHLSGATRRGGLEGSEGLAVL